jgi:hypothetical protein
VVLKAQVAVHFSLRSSLRRSSLLGSCVKDNSVLIPDYGDAKAVRTLVQAAVQCALLTSLFSEVVVFAWL